MWIHGWLHSIQAEVGGKGVEDNSWGKRFFTFWSCLLEGLEMLDLFLIVLDRIQLVMAFSALLSQHKVYAGTAFGICVWGQAAALTKGYWEEGKIATHFLESLRNKMRQKENSSLGCWWFLEENLICDLWFGLQCCVCTDFIAVEMRHLGTLASAGPLWAALPQEISHLLAGPSSTSAPKSFAWYWRQRSLGNYYAQLFSAKQCFEKQGTEISW